MRDAKISTNNKIKKNNISFGTVSITYISNPFEPLLSKESKTDLHGKALWTYLEGFCLGQEFLVSVNGQYFEDYDYIVKPNDIIVYVPIVQGGGGGGGAKDLVRLVAVVALTYFTFGAGGLAGGSFLGYSGFAGYALATTAFIAGSMLINAVVAPTTPNLSGVTSPEQESNMYSWGGISTNTKLNKPIPVLYGTMALGGTIINSKYTYPDGSDWLAIQLALCHGEIQSIEPDHIKIGGNAFSSVYGEAVDGNYKYVKGNFDQPVMVGFDDTVYNNGSVAQELPQNDPYIFTTASNGIDSFKLHLEAPKGLYLSDNTGNLTDKEVKYKVEYRKVGEVTWKSIYQRKNVYVTEYQHTSKDPSVNTGGGGGDGGYEGDGDFSGGYGFGDDDGSDYNGDSFGGDFGGWA